jgi:hypothetical protein
MITNHIPLLPLREKVARTRRMRGLHNAGSASRSAIPLTRQPSAATLSLKVRGKIHSKDKTSVRY